VLDEMTGAERLDLLFVDGGLVDEVGEDLVEEVGVGAFLGGGLLEQGFEAP
jgi:hypothetical protein